MDGRNRRWEEEKYGKKRRMGEMGVLKNEVDWGKRVVSGRGGKQEEKDRKNRIWKGEKNGKNRRIGEIGVRKRRNAGREG